MKQALSFDLKFEKYQATGNDFIMIDNRKKLFQEIKASSTKESSLIKKLCDRRFGIGADGLILINTHPDTDFEMKYFNSDGREGSMCGNGGRCAAAFARKLGITGKTHSNFMAVDGEHEAVFSGKTSSEDSEDIVKIKMINVAGVIQQKNIFLLDTGSPHIVKFTDETDKTDVFTEGSEIRNSKEYAPEGVNVNFVNYTKGIINIRTYERGVENETLACGTGSVAAAISVYLKYGSASAGVSQQYKIQAAGGKLKVRFETGDNENFTNIWLEGPARKVYEGTIKI